MSDLNKRCIESWKKYCPDYELIKISEDNFDYNKHEYSRKAYENKNWAFVSDIARLEALKEYGGFYLDTDVELFQSLDSLRDNNAIVHETGHGFYASGIMGCDKFPELYQRAYDKLEIGKAYYVLLNECAYEMYNLTGDSYHKEDEVTFYGVEYLGNPRTPITDRTIAVHWDENTWVDSWLGGFEHLADFIPFAIYNPELDVDLTMKLFRQVPENMVLTIDKDIKLDISVFELGNYFYNPKVVEVSKEGIEFKRIVDDKKHIISKQLDNGCTIRFYK